jgi:hypothetical protein
MKATTTSESSANFHQTTRRYNPEDSHLPIHSSRSPVYGEALKRVSANIYYYQMKRAGASDKAFQQRHLQVNTN